MKFIDIDEYLVAIGQRSKMIVKCESLLKQFVESGEEACIIEDKDLGKPNGYLKKQDNRNQHYNASYATINLKDGCKNLNLDMVEITNRKGVIYLARKEVL